MVMKSSVTKKLIPVIIIILAIVFVINNYVATRMLKNEVKDQWMQDDYKLVLAYAEELVNLDMIRLRSTRNLLTILHQRAPTIMLSICRT